MLLVSSDPYISSLKKISKMILKSLDEDIKALVIVEIDKYRDSDRDSDSDDDSEWNIVEYSENQNYKNIWSVNCKNKNKFYFILFSSYLKFYNN